MAKKNLGEALINIGIKFSAKEAKSGLNSFIKDFQKKVDALKEAQGSAFDDLGKEEGLAISKAFKDLKKIVSDATEILEEFGQTLPENGGGASKGLKSIADGAVNVSLNLNSIKKDVKEVVDEMQKLDRIETWKRQGEQLQKNLLLPVRQATEEFKKLQASLKREIPISDGSDETYEAAVDIPSDFTGSTDSVTRLSDLVSRESSGLFGGNILGNLELVDEALSDIEANIKIAVESEKTLGNLYSVRQQTLKGLKQDLNEIAISEKVFVEGQENSTENLSENLEKARSAVSGLDSSVQEFQERIETLDISQLEELQESALSLNESFDPESLEEIEASLGPLGQIIANRIENLKALKRSLDPNIVAFQDLKNTFEEFDVLSGDDEFDDALSKKGESILDAAISLKVAAGELNLAGDSLRKSKTISGLTDSKGNEISEEDQQEFQDLLEKRFQENLKDSSIKRGKGFFEDFNKNEIDEITVKIQDFKNALQEAKDSGESITDTTSEFALSLLGLDKAIAPLTSTVENYNEKLALLNKELTNSSNLDSAKTGLQQQFLQEAKAAVASEKATTDYVKSLKLLERLGITGIVGQTKALAGNEKEIEKLKKTIDSLSLSRLEKLYNPDAPKNEVNKLLQKRIESIKELSAEINPLAPKIEEFFSSLEEARANLSGKPLRLFEEKLEKDLVQEALNLKKAAGEITEAGEVFAKADRDFLSKRGTKEGTKERELDQAAVALDAQQRLEASQNRGKPLLEKGEVGSIRKVIKSVEDLQAAATELNGKPLIADDPRILKLASDLSKLSGSFRTLAEAKAEYDNKSITIEKLRLDGNIGDEEALRLQNELNTAYAQSQNEIENSNRELQQQAELLNDVLALGGQQAGGLAQSALDGSTQSLQDFKQEIKSIDLDDLKRIYKPDIDNAVNTEIKKRIDLLEKYNEKIDPAVAALRDFEKVQDEINNDLGVGSPEAIALIEKEERALNELLTALEKERIAKLNRDPNRDQTIIRDTPSGRSDQDAQDIEGRVNAEKEELRLIKLRADANKLLTRTSSGLREAVDKYKDGMTTLNAALREGIITQEEFNQGQDALRGELQSNSGLFTQIDQKLFQQTQRFKEFGFALADVGRNLVAFGGAAAGGLTAPIVAFAQFQQSVQDVVAVLTDLESIGEGTAISFGILSDTFLRLAERTEFTANQIATAAKELALAGFNAREITQSIESVISLASAGNLDPTAAAGIFSNILRAFKIDAQDAQRVADVLATIAVSSNVTVEKLGESFKLVSPIAANLGQTLEDTSAILGVLGNAGISASRAGTGLARAFSELVEKSGDFDEALKKVGSSFDKIDPEKVGIREIIRELEKLQKAGLLESSDFFELFDQRSARIVLTAINQGADAADDLAEKADLAANNARKIRDIKLDTVAGQFKILTSAISTLTIEFGEIFGGITTDLLKFFTDLINYATNFVQEWSTVIKVLGVVAVAAGVVSTAFGVLLIVSGALVRAIASVSQGLLFLSSALKVSAELQNLNNTQLAINTAYVRANAIWTSSTAVLSNMGRAVGNVLAMQINFIPMLTSIAASFTLAYQAVVQYVASLYASIPASIAANGALGSLRIGLTALWVNITSGLATARAAIIAFSLSTGGIITILTVLVGVLGAVYLNLRKVNSEARENSLKEATASLKIYNQQIDEASVKTAKLAKELELLGELPFLNDLQREQLFSGAFSEGDTAFSDKEAEDRLKAQLEKYEGLFQDFSNAFDTNDFFSPIFLDEISFFGLDELPESIAERFSLVRDEISGQFAEYGQREFNLSVDLDKEDFELTLEEFERTLTGFQLGRKTFTDIKDLPEELREVAATFQVSFENFKRQQLQTESFDLFVKAIKGGRGQIEDALDAEQRKLKTTKTLLEQQGRIQKNLTGDALKRAQDTQKSLERQEAQLEKNVEALEGYLVASDKQLELAKQELEFLLKIQKENKIIRDLVKRRATETQQAQRATNKEIEKSFDNLSVLNEQRREISREATKQSKLEENINSLLEERLGILEDISKEAKDSKEDAEKSAKIDETKADKFENVIDFDVETDELFGNISKDQLFKSKGVKNIEEFIEKFGEKVNEDFLLSLGLGKIDIAEILNKKQLDELDELIDAEQEEFEKKLAKIDKEIEEAERLNEGPEIIRNLKLEREKEVSTFKASPLKKSREQVEEDQAQLSEDKQELRKSRAIKRNELISENQEKLDNEEEKRKDEIQKNQEARDAAILDGQIRRAEALDQKQEVKRLKRVKANKALEKGADNLFLTEKERQKQIDKAIEAGDKAEVKRLKNLKKEKEEFIKQGMRVLDLEEKTAEAKKKTEKQSKALAEIQKRFNKEEEKRGKTQDKITDHILKQAKGFNQIVAAIKLIGKLEGRNAAIRRLAQDKARKKAVTEAIKLKNIEKDPRSSNQKIIRARSSAAAAARRASELGVTSGEINPAQGAEFSKDIAIPKALTEQLLKSVFNPNAIAGQFLEVFKILSENLKTESVSLINKELLTTELIEVFRAAAQTFRDEANMPQPNFNPQIPDNLTNNPNQDFQGKAIDNSKKVTGNNINISIQADTISDADDVLAAIKEKQAEVARALFGQI